jgi:hypothetical protein
MQKLEEIPSPVIPEYQNFNGDEEFKNPLLKSKPKALSMENLCDPNFMF